MATFEICEEGRKADRCGDGEEGRAIGARGEEVEQRGEEKAGGLLFGGEAQELGVESEDFLFPAGDRVSLVEVYGAQEQEWIRTFQGLYQPGSLGSLVAR